MFIIPQWSYWKTCAYVLFIYFVTLTVLEMWCDTAEARQIATITTIVMAVDRCESKARKASVPRCNGR